MKFIKANSNFDDRMKKIRALGNDIIASREIIVTTGIRFYKIDFFELKFFFPTNIKRHNPDY